MEESYITLEHTANHTCVSMIYLSSNMHHAQAVPTEQCVASCVFSIWRDSNIFKYSNNRNQRVFGHGRTYVLHNLNTPYVFGRG